MSRHWNEGDKVGAFVLLKRVEGDDTRTSWEARCKCGGISVVVPGNVLRRSKVRPATCRPCWLKRAAKLAKRPKRCTGCDTTDAKRFARSERSLCMACTQARARHGLHPCGRPRRYVTGSRFLSIPCDCATCKERVHAPALQ